MSKTQEQRDHDEWLASERELTSRWLRILAKPVPGDPEPQPTRPSADELAGMDHGAYGALRAVLGIGTASEMPGTTSWADRRDARLAAQQAASKSHPDPMADYARERAEAGLKVSTSEIFGADTPNARTHTSPWQL